MRLRPASDRRSLSSSHGAPMSISDGMHVIAEFGIVGVSGSRGVGISRLQFATEVEVGATPGKQVLVTSPVCFACAGPSTDAMKPLGRTSIETSWYTQTAEHSRREGLSVFVDLSWEQIEALERLRNGRLLIFRLDIHAIVQSQSRGLQRGFQQAFYELNVSAWSKVLKELGYMDLLLLAVELPLHGVPEWLMSASQEFRKAHEDLIAGRYDTVIARIRLVAEAIDRVIPSDQSRSALIETFAKPDARQRMSKDQRAEFVRVALRHYTHLAHHPDTKGGTQTFSRHDAMFVLAAAAALLWDALGRHLVRATPRAPEE